MKFINKFCVGILLIGVIFSSLYSQAEKDFSDEIMVYFTSAVEYNEMKKGIEITSNAIKDALKRFNIDAQSMSRAFPDFKKADTIVISIDGRGIKMPDLSKIYKIKIPKGKSRKQVIDALSKCPEVLFAEPNGIANPDAVPNDDRFDEQWGLKNGNTGRDIHATQAWDICKGSSNNIIAIVGGGIDATHDDLSGKVSGDEGYGWGGHGIRVAGVAAAKTNNIEGIAGVTKESV